MFCRYKFKNAIHYGEVEGQLIFELDGAPWQGGARTGPSVPLAEVQLLHPSEPQTILGLAAAYRKAWRDKTPYGTIRWFAKPPSSVASPDDDVVMPPSLDLLVVETELTIVIGKTAKNISEKEARAAIFGYTVGNDLMGDRDSYYRVQGESPDPADVMLTPSLKMGDGFAPFGPFIYTAVDWRNRKCTLNITNPEAEKDLSFAFNTSDLVYTPEKIVSDISRVLTLSPGDIILTGTPEPGRAAAGDVVTVAIEGLGTLTNRIVASK